MSKTKWNLDFYDGSEGYSEGEIEDEILEIIKSGKDIEKVLEEDHRWPILYHLSPQRENILNWYPFKKESSLLEIGAGCGALTTLFCRTVKKVSSVELTKKRSEINFERNKNKENLEIITGNFHDIKFKEKFDYIVLNGVFEYAGSFKDSKTPYLDFLKELRSLLNPNGIILIAIENRLGIKYFTGAKEDHTAQLFSGLNAYEGIDFVKTFSENEWQDLAQKANYHYTQFYFPLADYKFTEAVYTKDSLQLMNFNTPEKIFDGNRFSFFNEEAMVRSLMNEGIFEKFSNSFLVELSDADFLLREEEVLYAKISNYRKKKYSIITKIVKEKNKTLVFKLGTNAESVKHVKKMLKYQNKVDGFIHNIPLKEVKNGVKMEHLDLPTFDELLIDQLKNGDLQGFEKRIFNFYSNGLKGSVLEENFYSDDFKAVFGSEKVLKPLHCKKNVNIDLIFSNIFVQNNTCLVIDYEWYFDFLLPLEYTVWRSLRTFFINNPIVKEYYSFETLTKIVDLDIEEVESVFEKWDQFFMTDYVGIQEYRPYQKQKFLLEPELVDDLLNKYQIMSSVSLDFGEGFLKENLMAQSLETKNDLFELDYDLSEITKEVKVFRFDPCEEICKVRNLKIEMDGVEQKVVAINALVHHEDWDYFTTNDPVFLIETEIKHCEKMKISGELIKLEKAELIAIANDVFGKKDRIINDQNTEINHKNIAINHQTTEINHQNAVIHDQKTEIEHQKKELAYKNKEMDLLKKLLENYRNQNDVILGSTSWKITKPIRVIKDIIIKGKK